ncbi:hypothetical protein BKA66DRAFT_463353 [Pyrenochaeta sp. MPI-SDFR-AT-0127]|nr:hypothetical protein BKA66DRAFT_463353 [Pyrenochaeta sp. MPI-SDFR-AT-0127]
MPPVGSQRPTFFPKADATVLQSKNSPPLLESRPTAVAPILDVDNHDRALHAWTVEVAESVYPSQDDIWAPATIPQRSLCATQCSADRYLFPILTRNERLRLTMLFYYTRGVLEDQELMSRLQEKVLLAQESVGWEFVIAGLLNHNTYTRMVTVGLPLAVLPRRESTCAHTVNQPPGTVFSLLNMVDDWRFKESPHVEQGGLRSYAGVPLRFETEFGEHVAFGSLCVASNSPQEQLSTSQQRSLARLADWIVSDIVHSARARRQRERRRMLEILTKVQKLCDEDVNMEEVIPEMLREVYPSTTVAIHQATDGKIDLEGGTIFRTSELEHGLWEDCNYFDYVIKELNHQEMVASRVVRVISTQCVSQRTPTFLVVGSKDFRLVFDDVDSWFVQMFATILCRYWQGQALKEAMAAKETFLRGITHQLRTPIHGILGSIELLTEELKSRNVVPSTAASSPSATPDAETLDPYVYIKTIKTSARELIGTVNSLIKLNQWADIAQAQRVVALHKISDIQTALLNETLLALPEDPLSRPTVICLDDLPSNYDTIIVDVRLFLDCIQPLVVNAMQHTAGGVVAVTLSLIDGHQSLIVDVEDNGSGIAASNCDRIFNAYEKVDLSTTDAGLGLTLASKSATLMNGNVALVSSKLGQGSHFRATFHEPVFASSFPQTRSLKERLVQLPTAFHRSTSHAQTPSLGHYFSKYLINRGYIESERSEGSFLILEYTPNLAQLYNQVSNISTGQVAICLVPDAVYFIDFYGERIRRQDNVVYVQSPFLPSTFEEALEQADKILTEFGASTLNSGSCPFGGVALDPTPVPSPPPTDCPPELPTRWGSIFPQAIQKELAQSVERLQIGTESGTVKMSSSIRSVKPMTLLVDDNVINLRLLEMYCSRRGIPYRAAKDGQEAVQIFSESLSSSTATYDPLTRQQLHTQPFKLILMDLQMPVCDGIDATRQIRETEKQHGLEKSVLFIVTGQDSVVDRTNAEDAGADGYLVKPVGPKVLDRWVKHWFPDAEL